MTDVSLRHAWRLADAKIMQDAKEFWRTQDVMGPEDMERRANQLVTVAYSLEKIIGVLTAKPIDLDILRARFMMFRVLIAPEWRRRMIAYQLTASARDLLEQWSLDNPQENIVGMVAAIQADEFKERRHSPTVPEYGLNFNLVGYTEAGEQIRVIWFQHAFVE